MESEQRVITYASNTTTSLVRYSGVQKTGTNTPTVAPTGLDTQTSSPVEISNILMLNHSDVNSTSNKCNRIRHQSQFRRIFGSRNYGNRYVSSTESSCIPSPKKCTDVKGSCNSLFDANILLVPSAVPNMKTSGRSSNTATSIGVQHYDFDTINPEVRQFDQVSPLLSDDRRSTDGKIENKVSDESNRGCKENIDLHVKRCSITNISLSPSFSHFFYGGLKVRHSRNLS
jgi:hypothetical protein